MNSLFSEIKKAFVLCGVESNQSVSYKDFRLGDVRHSQADISKAKQHLGYEPEHKIRDGLEKAMPWYKEFLSI